MIRDTHPDHPIFKTCTYILKCIKSASLFSFEKDISDIKHTRGYLAVITGQMMVKVWRVSAQTGESYDDGLSPAWGNLTAAGS